MQINEMASSIADQCHVIGGVIMVGDCPFEQKSKELLVAWPYPGSSMVLWLQCRRRCPSTANNCRALNTSPGRLDSRAATKASDGVLGLNMVVIDERERLLVHHAKLIILSGEVRHSNLERREFPNESQPSPVQEKPSAMGFGKFAHSGVVELRRTPVVVYWTTSTCILIERRVEDPIETGSSKL
nr:hypothetical protein Iba_scaffold3049CG1050 [Ipomoea batatas]GME12436.1 hypothetical protein Iba_scaffold13751CG0010 [Ipomoea batatas]